MIILSKHNGYSPDGRRLLFMGGGGGGQPTQTTSNVNQSNIPEYAKPYVENMLGATQQQLFKGTQQPNVTDAQGNVTQGNFNITGFQPYKAYGGTYDEQGNQTSYDAGRGIAGFQPMQTLAQRGVAGLQVPGQFAQGAQGSMDVAGQANVGGFQNQVGGYMSPYMQNVTDIQKREAARQSGIQGTQQQAQATQAGAFGGSRDAIMRAERERNLETQMNDIQAQGSQAAFQSAQQQYNQNLQNQLAGYGQAGALAGQGLQAQQGIYGLQNQYGAQQQGLEQQKLNQAMQDYSNAQQYPLMQLGTMSNMIRGLPMQASTTQQYQAQANPITQGIGLAGAAGSLYNAYKGGAEGGLPSEFKYASGGITSVPRYDVGGAVQSQLMNMDDQSLAREAKESPSPEIKRMAQAILKQRQAGMNTGNAPQPQMQDVSNVDYNANYAGGGIIAFQKGETVPRTPIVSDIENRLTSDTDAIDAQIRQRAALHAASAVDTRTPRTPELYRAEVPPSPYAENENLSLTERMANTRNRIRSRTDPTFTPPETAASIAPAADTVPTPAGIASVRRSPREAELAAARGYQAPPASAPGAITSLPAASPRSPRAAELAAARGYQAPQAGPAAPQAGPAAPKTGIATVPSATAAAPDTTAGGIPELKLPQFMQDERAGIEADKNKTALDYMKQIEADKKSLGLDTSEARQQRMQEAMAEKASLKDEAERNKHLRLAEFFASWGSTPGNTLVAGMTALKAKIPDMISDVKDQRKALAESNNFIAQLQEADRQERLGNYDAATKLKEAVATRAEKFNERLTQYAYHTQNAQIQAAAAIRGHEISRDSAADVANIHGKYQLAAANLTKQTNALVQQGQLDVKQQMIIQKSAEDLNRLSAQLEANKSRPNSPYANAQKAIQDAALTKNPDSPLKAKAVEAQKIIDGVDAAHAKQLSEAWQRTENLYKKYAGSESYTSPTNPYSRPTPAAINTPADIQALIDKHTIK